MLAWMRSNEPYDTKKMKLCKYVQWRQHAEKIRRKVKELQNSITSELKDEADRTSCTEDLNSKVEEIMDDDKAILLEKF